MTMDAMKSFSLSEGALGRVAGGAMPEGYYDELYKFLQGAAAEGVRMEDMLADLKAEFASGLPDGMTQQDVKDILDFVEKRWPKK